MGDRLPVPPALVYLLHQLKVNNIRYHLFGEIPGTEMAYVDLDRDYAANLKQQVLPDNWSMITPHFLANRALVQGQQDPIQQGEEPESIVIAYGDHHDKEIEHLQGICEQIRYLREQVASRLVYHKAHPPEPMEIHQLIKQLKGSDLS
ncbi:hypothetical protein [Reinekea thalattae]|nr:hypothetical protein [Reinekea thalattae]